MVEVLVEAEQAVVVDVWPGEPEDGRLLPDGVTPLLRSTSMTFGVAFLRMMVEHRGQTNP
ncbi:MAG TPA: hypothetical protein VFF32_04315 [Dermatophilaceae bacterium]|nr:hypothetical protein [Dermatophilaceae bacterium]